MKKSVKMLLMVFAVAFGVLLVSGTTSKAAAWQSTWNSGLKATGQKTQSVDLQWNTYIGDERVDSYIIYLGNDLDNMKRKSQISSSQTHTTVYGLAPGGVYYVAVVPVNGYGNAEVALDVGEAIQIGTVPVVNPVTGLKQTSATANSITMTWSPVSGATAYDVYRYNGYNDYTLVGQDLTTTSHTVGGLNTNMSVYYFVIAKQTVAATGITGQSSEYTRVAMRTVPAKVTLLAITNYWQYLGEAVYGWGAMSNVSGYEFELRNSNNKVLTKKDTGTSASAGVDPFPKGVFTKARARAYITVDNKKIYGPWSNYLYSASTKKCTVKRSANKKKITVKWTKVKGATSYKVSMATKSNGKYKKVKTLSKKKSSLTITKYGKKKLSKNKKYFIRVEYLIKVGKKTYTSKIFSGDTSGI